MNRRRGWSFFAFACLLGSAEPAWAEIALGPFLPKHVWPISKGDVPTRHISATFGPRLKFSTTYDFHRGIDIPAPHGTPIHVVADGVVRIAGSSPAYVNPLVQIKHYKPTSGGSCSNGGCYYTNYLHISAATVSVGHSVKRGEIIGYTGESDAGFEHLHFEVRDGGLYSMHCIHPLAILPRDRVKAPEVRLTSVDASTHPGSVIVAGEVEIPLDEQDLNRVEVDVYDTSSGQMLLADSFAFDFNDWNRLYSPKDDPDLYLGQPTYNGITLIPSRFKDDPSRYHLSFMFLSLVGPLNPHHVFVRASAVDLDANVGRDESP